MCSDYENPTIKPAPTSGRGRGPGLQKPAIHYFGFTAERTRGAHMIHSLCILLSISKTSFSKLPIHQQHPCLLSPRDEIRGEPPPLVWCGVFYGPRRLETGGLTHAGFGQQVRSSRPEVEMGPQGRVWLLGRGTNAS